jgi:ABC-type tungstate transport system permease subunit
VFTRNVSYLLRFNLQTLLARLTSDAVHQNCHHVCSIQVPQADPQKTWGSDIVAAHHRVATGGENYVSCGDRSGNHAAELRFWSLVGMPAPAFAGYQIDSRQVFFAHANL